MKSALRASFAWLGVLTWWAVLVPASAAQPLYSLTDLGVAGGFDSSRARGISNSGLIAGDLADSAGANFDNGFRWANGTLTQIMPVQNGFILNGFGANNGGIVAGTTNIEVPDGNGGFTYK
jgi:hypothetical protein